ncbi:hypothetical protein HDV05_004118 [Chytridiales sp. JEL 0842]|nr:hypothetical protein HDV05_004118 [Chytridiales sp. JEL 0842]
MIKISNDRTFDYFLSTDGYQASWKLVKEVVRPVVSGNSLTPASVFLPNDATIHFIDKGRVTLFDINTVRRQTPGVVMRCKRPMKNSYMRPEFRKTNQNNRRMEAKEKSSKPDDRRVVKDSRQRPKFFAQNLPSLDIPTIESLEQRSKNDNGQVDHLVLRKLQQRHDRSKPRQAPPRKGLAKFQDILERKSPNEDVEYNWRITAKEWRNLTGHDSYQKLREKVDLLENVDAYYKINFRSYQSQQRALETIKTMFCGLPAGPDDPPRLTKDKDDIAIGTGNDGDWEDQEEEEEDDLLLVAFDDIPIADHATNNQLLSPSGDTLMQLPSPTGLTSAPTTMATHEALCSVYGTKFWKLELLGGVYPAGGVRKVITDAEANKKVTNIVKVAESEKGRVLDMRAPVTHDGLVEYFLHRYDEGSRYGGLQRERENVAFHFVTGKTSLEAPPKIRKKEKKCFSLINWASQGRSMLSRWVKNELLLRLAPTKYVSKRLSQGFQAHGEFKDHHQYSVQDISHVYGTTVDLVCPNKSQGLTALLVEERQKTFGLNVLSGKKPPNQFLEYLKEYSSPFQILLLVAGAVALTLFGVNRADQNNLYLGVILIGVMVINATLAFVQKKKAASILASFAAMVPQKTRVFRDGCVNVIEAKELVVGDIVHIKEGDQVPADMMLFSCSPDCTADQSALTGEAEPVAKHHLQNIDGSVAYMEACNLMFFGTMVARGEAYGIVIRTGNHTTLGEIVQVADQGDEEDSPMKQETSIFVRQKALLAISVGLIIFGVGFAPGLDFPLITNAVNLIGILSSFIPQGMPSTAVSLLTFTALRLSKRNVVVKSLDGVEALGSITLLASDKTGTLTQNKMTAVHSWFGVGKFLKLAYRGSPANRDDITVAGRPEKLNEFNPKDEIATLLVQGCVLGSRAVCERLEVNPSTALPRVSVSNETETKIIGDATETGLLRFAIGCMIDINKMRDDHPRVFEIPFTSTTKVHLSVHRMDGFYRAFLKGAPERVLDQCINYMDYGASVVIDSNWRTSTFLPAYEAFGRRGERVIAFAYIDLPTVEYDIALSVDKLFNREDDKYPTSGFTFVGLISLMDPPKEGVAEAVGLCRRAGIRVMMVTGDHPITAEAIGRQIGLISGPAVYEVMSNGPMTPAIQNPAIVLHGDSIANLTEDCWAKIFSTPEVIFARTSPHHKLTIVTKAQEYGHIVCVTGDGVNDAPALKRSDLGVSMGISGSDASKKAASMILMDDNFVSIVEGIRQGRTIFENLRKSIAFTLAHIFPEFWPFILQFAAGIPLGMTAILILLIDLGAELGMDISFAFDPPESTVMDVPPRKPALNKDGIPFCLNERKSKKSTFHRMWNRAAQGLSLNRSLTGDSVVDFSNAGPSKPKFTFDTMRQAFVRNFIRAERHGIQVHGETLIDLSLLFWAYLQAGTIITCGSLGNYLLVYYRNGISLDCLTLAGRNFPTQVPLFLCPTTGKTFDRNAQLLVYREAVAAWYAGIMVQQCFNLFMCKTRREYPWRSVYFKNVHTYTTGILLTVCIVCFVVYTPFMNDAVGTAPVHPLHLLPSFAGGFVLCLYELSSTTTSSPSDFMHSTRIMVKNLPKHMTIERFRQHFGAKGEVTDARLARTAEGVFRRFGFIGYKTNKEAKAAVDYFNKTFIDTSRIEVVIAKPIGDASLPRAWSKYSAGSSANRKLTEEQQKQEDERIAKEEALKKKKSASASSEKQIAHELAADLTADKSDPKLREFLEVMRPRGAARARTWANDDDLGIEATAAPTKSGPKHSASAGVKDGLEEIDDDDDDYQDLPTVSADSEDKKDRKKKEKEAKGDSLALDSTMSDLDYFKARMKADLEEDEDEDADEHMEDVEEAAAKSDESDDDDEKKGVKSSSTRKKKSLHQGDEEEESDEDDEDIMDSDDAPKADATAEELTGKAKIAKEILDLFNPEKPSSDTDDANPNSADLPARALLKSQSEEIPPAELIADTGRLFVKNLAYTCTADELQSLFEQFGPVAEVHMSIEKISKKPRGYAFVTFMIPEHAVKAYVSLDGKFYQGRILEVLPGKEKPAEPEVEEVGPNSSHKKKVEAKRKANALNDSNWNSLFMNSDAVAEAMAKKLGVKKSEILDPSSENMAVRLALAETEIINETKKYLEDEGIDLNAFSKRKERSKTVILVKNIPFSTSVDDITDLFGKFGSLGRVLVPPSATIAMVEFLEQNEAKSAFRNLAYTKFKGGLPLFLEYAPVNSFKKEFDPVEAEARRKEREERLALQKEQEEKERAQRANGDDEDESSDNEKDVDARVAAIVSASSKKAVLENEMNSKADDLDDPDAMPVATLFVKNLSFNTTQDGLRKAFEPLGGVRAVRIAMKPDTKNAKKLPPGTPAPMLSMGFGFIEFESKEAAVKAMKSMQGFKLDGHELSLKFSNAAAKSTQSSSTSSASNKKRGPEEVKVTGTKLIIRNIPFEASKKEVRQLFSTFGQVKSLRMPKKFDGSHRGFGFIDFLTKQEAKAAYESLSSTHLYGRHLVMEWAEDESSVEAMRAKTAKGFFKDSEGLPPQKRRKVEMGGDSMVDDMEDMSD